MASFSPLLHSPTSVKLERFEPTFSGSYSPMRSESPSCSSVSSDQSTSTHRPKRKYTARQPLEAPKRIKSERSNSLSSCSDTGSCDSSISLVELKRERRKQQNRAASANSRMKKKAYVDEMEGKIAVLVSQQQALIASMNALRAENDQLKQQVGLQQQPVTRCVSGSSVEWEMEGNEHVSEDHVSSPFSCPSSPSTPLASMSPLSDFTDSSFEDSSLVLPSSSTECVESLHAFDYDTELTSMFSSSQCNAIYESAVERIHCEQTNIEQAQHSNDHFWDEKSANTIFALSPVFGPSDSAFVQDEQFNEQWILD